MLIDGKSSIDEVETVRDIVVADVPIASLVRRLILNPASVGSGRKRGETWTLRVEVEWDVRGKESGGD